jgi:ABC-type hemin transport system ATPase subunit
MSADTKHRRILLKLSGEALCSADGFGVRAAPVGRVVEQLLGVLHRLRDEGNTVVVIEHNLDVIKTADWIVDLGPEGGDGGGRVIAEGTPEQVSRSKASYTGHYLASMLARTGAPARRRA